MEVKFYEIDEVNESLFKYAVIVARYTDKWIFCKNKNRKWELPGGHREIGESIIETTKRELIEETGALKFEIRPICAYRINNFGINPLTTGREAFGSSVLRWLCWCIGAPLWCVSCFALVKREGAIV